MSPLAQRVATVAVVLPLALLAVFALPPPLFALATLFLVLAAANEWSRLVGFTMRQALAFAIAVGLATMALRLLVPLDAVQPWASPRLTALTAVATVFWLVIAPAWVMRRWPPRGKALMAVIGAVVLLGFWVAIVQLQARSPWLLLAAMAVVWIADTAAYFTGRAFGRHKLAPLVSPGKTWEGVAGAVVAVGIYVTGCAYALAQAGLVAPPGAATLAAWLLVGIVLTAVSVIGDLFESWLKRAAGVKDSGRLLPGHGGILDRIDALLAALPVAALAIAQWLPRVPT